MERFPRQPLVHSSTKLGRIISLTPTTKKHHYLYNLLGTQTTIVFYLGHCGHSLGISLGNTFSSKLERVLENTFGSHNTFYLINEEPPDITSDMK